MKIAFDPAKDAINIAKHGLSLSRAAELEILVFIEDVRTNYGEVRCRAWGVIERDGSLRAISLRRAHQREIDRHAPPGPE